MNVDEFQNKVIVMKINERAMSSFAGLFFLMFFGCFFPFSNSSKAAEVKNNGEITGQFVCMPLELYLKRKGTVSAYTEKNNWFFVKMKGRTGEVKFSGVRFDLNLVGGLVGKQIEYKSTDTSILKFSGVKISILNGSIHEMNFDSAEFVFYTFCQEVAGNTKLF